MVFKSSKINQMPFQCECWYSITNGFFCGRCRFPDPHPDLFKNFRNMVGETGNVLIEVLGCFLLGSHFYLAAEGRYPFANASSFGTTRNGLRKNWFSISHSFATRAASWSVQIPQPCLRSSGSLQALKTLSLGASIIRANVRSRCDVASAPLAVVMVIAPSSLHVLITVSSS